MSITMKKIGKLALVLFLFLNIQITNAQLERFQTGLIGGLNFSELEGEGITDYFGIL